MALCTGNRGVNLGHADQNAAAWSMTLCIPALILSKRQSDEPLLNNGDIISDIAALCNQSNVTIIARVIYDVVKACSKLLTHESFAQSVEAGNDSVTMQQHSNAGIMPEDVLQLGGTCPVFELIHAGLTCLEFSVHKLCTFDVIIINFIFLRRQISTYGTIMKSSACISSVALTELAENVIQSVKIMQISDYASEKMLQVNIILFNFIY